MKLLKLGVENADVNKWQYALMGQGFYYENITGKFDVTNHAATIAFHKAQQLQLNGIAHKIAVSRAMQRNVL